jgi:isoleucyl-tRNA synthetase
MSKSLGNVVTPEEVIAKVGVDILRLYVLSSSAPWDDLKFNWENVGTVNRAANILWNVYRFPLPYMILDKFEPASKDGVWDGAYVASHLRQMPDEDRWIISRVNSVAATVDKALKECQLHRATRELINFILEDLSRWYVQLVRERMWIEGESDSKLFAYETIYYVMRRLTGLLAPFCPHITEEIYRNLRCGNDPESIHMLSWDSGEKSLVDGTLEHAMEVIRQFDDANANARQAGKRKLRWPVSEVVVVTSVDAVRDAIARLNSVCVDRANARKVTVIMDRWDRVGWRAEPVMKALGKGFGKDSFRIKALIEAADGNAIKAAVDAGLTVTLAEGESAFEIGAEHVTFTEKLPEDVFSAAMPDATVYVDIRLTTELEAEGYAREIIRRIQETRRQLDLAVEDFIVADVTIADERICSLVRDSWLKGIREEVRAQELSIRSPGESASCRAYDSVKDWDVEGVAMTISIGKAIE